MWGHTPVVVHRSFVVSVAGTVLLLPIRAVLWGIRVVEERAGQPFEFAQRSAWIGLLAAAVGASISTAVLVLGRGAVRRMRRVRPAG